MHGRVKSEQKELTEEEKQYIARAKQLFDECIELINQDQKKSTFSVKTLELTEKILKINTEVLTMWNFRKSYIVSEQSNSQLIDNILNNELILTESLFKNDPKSYNLWSNRAWLLEFIVNLKDADKILLKVEEDYLKNISNFDNLNYIQPFKKSLAKYSNIRLKLLINELELCNRLFEVDDRNFHCWRHRSFVLCCLRYVSVDISWDTFLEEMQLQELEFLNTMIETNFSNYSAWHNRTLLAFGHQFNSIQDFNRESEFIHTAIYTEPNDQSIWQYYFWLMGDFLPKILFKNEQFEVNPSFHIKDLQVKFPENKDDQIRIHIKFSLPCLIDGSVSSLSIESEDGSKITLDKGTWEPIYEDYASIYGFFNSKLNSDFDNKRKKRSVTWSYSLSLKENSQDEIRLITNLLNHSPSIFLMVSAACSDTIYTNTPNWNLNDPEYKNETFSSLRISPKLILDEYKFYSFNTRTNDNIVTCKYYFQSESSKTQLNEWIKILQSEFELLKSIQEIEPECKYPIIALKFVNDIYHLCSTPDIAKDEKIKVDPELIKLLPTIDPVRKLYYSEKFNIA
ncbi:Protein prenyltransferase alpha subunit repeat family protein [Cryptosporidium meleagridis]|uniref:Geranylgeranyl transferase type-2 subunit alpha n=1 Tax=Cryptosporidium meleagridis TaxID=93969 RepID=A0A2P4YY07_9CRYT|nr:Protein prenyltransferase alpha subunit repeat family protein [Cryptosporidium meleagridis]